MFLKLRLKSIFKAVFVGSADTATAATGSDVVLLDDARARPDCIRAGEQPGGPVPFLAEEASDEAKRCLIILLGDRARCGELAPERVDSLAEKRKLNPADRAWLYGQLGIGVLEGGARLDDVEDLGDNTDGIEIEAETRENHKRSEDPVTLLLKSVEHLRFLTTTEERTLGRQVRNGLLMREAVLSGTIQDDASVREAIARGQVAHERMVLSNIRLVVSVARKYDGWSSLDLADVVQEGIIGLMRAIDKYEPDLGYKLSTYATWWIRQAITRAMHDTGKIIRFPVHVAEKIAKLRKVERRLTSTYGASPTIAKLANELGWPIEQTEEVHAHSQMSYSHIGDEGDEEEGRWPLILIDTAPSPYEVYERKEMQEIVRELVAGLPDREREIIERRFGFDPADEEEETLAEIGEDHGVTRERIRQIEAKALGRLRHPKRIRPLLPYRLDEKSKVEEHD